MTRDEIRALAEKAMPCGCGGDSTEAPSMHLYSCPCHHRPTIEAALIEACERVLEEAARRIEDRRERYAEHGYGASSAGPMMNDDDVETVRALAAALKEEPNDG